MDAAAVTSMVVAFGAAGTLLLLLLEVLTTPDVPGRSSSDVWQLVGLVLGCAFVGSAVLPRCLRLVRERRATPEPTPSRLDLVLMVVAVAAVLWFLGNALIDHRGPAVVTWAIWAALGLAAVADVVRRRRASPGPGHNGGHDDPG